MTVADFEYNYVTCGSSLKILNTYNNVRLHSHDVKYGSGSGQQVTGMLYFYCFRSVKLVRNIEILIRNFKHEGFQDPRLLYHLIREMKKLF